MNSGSIGYRIGFLLRAGVSCLALSVIFGEATNGQTDVRIGVGSMSMLINEIDVLDAVSTVVYPADYAVYGSMGCVYGGGFVIASRDFKSKWIYDQSTGRWTEIQQSTTVPYFVSEASTRYYQDLQHSTVPVSIKRYWKYRPPDRIVKGTNYSGPDWGPYDEVAGPTMVCEQMVVAVCNTSSGISLTQRAYAFASRPYDDFIIVEYVFKNTGNINSDDAVEYPSNQVQQCYLGLDFVPQPSGLGPQILSGNTSWAAGVDDWIDYYAGTVRGDSIRVLYGWDGDSPANAPTDDEGDPYPASGIFMSTQYPGMAVLHVDRGVNDGTNDPNQPTMAYYSFGGASSGNAFSIRAGGSLGAEGIWNEFNSGKKFRSPFNWNTWNTSRVEDWADGNNPNKEYYKTGTLGFGPYNFRNLNDSVRIVVCYAVGSMGWAQAVNVGQKWKKTVSNIAGGISIKDKNVALRLGRDSLFANISRVSKLFRDSNGNFNLSKGAALIGVSPKSPNLTLAPNSAGVGIDLQWENVGAVKYRIYRRLKPSFRLDDAPAELSKDPYPAIATVTGTSWTDTTVSIGKNYWYAVTAVDAAGLESSRFLNRTDPTASDPLRGSVTSTGSLLNVFVVPNPYDRRSERLYSMASNTITFYGLTPECRIRIYTQSGDLVVTLRHSPSSGNVEQWNLLSDSQQYIASGLYFYVVDQTKDDTGRDFGLATRGKFVIIR